MTNSEQAIREFIFIQIRILTALGDIKGAVVEPEDDFMNNHIERLTALISEHTQEMFEFVKWIGFYSTTLYYRDLDEKWLRTRFDVDGCPTEEYDEYTTEELFEYWKENER